MSLPPYAPVAGALPTASYACLGQTPAQNLDQEVPLYTTSQEREIQESLAEVYSIIVTLDHVEKAYVKDTLQAGDDEYTPTVLRLLTQYNTLLKTPEVQERFVSLTHFKKLYGLQCPQATARIEIGVPATVEHALAPKTATNSGGLNAQAVAEAVAAFTSLVDALKLKYRAKDQLHPIMSDLMKCVNKVSPQNFEGRAKLIEWLIKINKMNAYDELSQDEARDLLFEVDNAYKGFYTMLE